MDDTTRTDDIDLDINPNRSRAGLWSILLLTVAALVAVVILGHSKVSNLETGLTAETEARTAADKVNADALTAETEARTAADKVNADALTAETEARTEAQEKFDAVLYGTDTSFGLIAKVNVLEHWRDKRESARARANRVWRERIKSEQAAARKIELLDVTVSDHEERLVVVEDTSNENLDSVNKLAQQLEVDLDSI